MKRIDQVSLNSGQGTMNKWQP